MNQTLRLRRILAQCIDISIITGLVFFLVKPMQQVFTFGFKSIGFILRGTDVGVLLLRTEDLGFLAAFF